MSNALVVLSGGQDSTTCLFWARAVFDRVSAITFDYGQRHRIEIDAARDIARLAGVDEHLVLDLSGFGRHSATALTDRSIALSREGGLGNLPSSFVPGRNLVFLTIAAGLAANRGVHDLVTGVCQTDYSGYPDCRRDTIDALERAINLGLPVATERDRMRIHTPLMWITKAESVSLAARLPGCMEALAHSVTCYQGQRPGCGQCPACLLRAEGFEQAGLPDPASR